VDSEERASLIAECADLLVTRDRMEQSQIFMEFLGIFSFRGWGGADEDHQPGRDDIVSTLMGSSDSSIQDLHLFLIDSGREAQPPAAWYKHVEDWFGEPFDDKLAYRIANMPKKQLRAYRLSFPPTDWTLPEIQPMKLRPALAAPLNEINPSWRLSYGLRLLMYSHEVILEAHNFRQFFFKMPSLYKVDNALSNLRHAIKIRSLVENGSIHFAPVYDRLWLFPGGPLKQLTQMPEIKRLALEKYPEVDTVSDEWASWLQFACGGIVATCELASTHRAHVLAHSEFTQEILRALLQRPITDNRQILLKTLAALEVPALTGDISKLVALRESESSFAEWRSKLGDALKYVGELGDEASINEASDVVHAQLMDGLAPIAKAAKKSPILAAMKGTFTGLIVTGMTAGTSAAMTGKLWQPLASGAVGKVADGVVAYMKALKEQRQQRLILDVAMYFENKRE
jgi:hypothetical protein